MYTLRFGDYEFPNQTFEIDGLPLDSNVQESRIPKRDGSVIQDAYLNSRKIRISGTIHSNDAATSYTLLLAMQAALLVKEEKSFKDRSDRYLKCRTKSVKPKFVKGTDKAVMDVDIELVAKDPFFLSETKYTDERVPTSGAGYAITNAGNAPTRMKVEVTAPAGGIADNCQMENTTRGELFKYRGIIAGTEKLEVDNRYDTDDFEVLNNGVDDHANFEGDFLHLSAAGNTIEFTGEPGSTVKLTYRAAWY